MEKIYSASVGSAWSGEIRGLLHVDGRVIAECVSTQEALDLSAALNRTHQTPEQIRNSEARWEINDLLPLAKMLDGRDNQNNWTRKLEQLMACFVGESGTVKDSLQVPEIPGGWIVWDRVIPWEKVAKRAQMWDGSSWFEMRLSDAPPPAWRIIIPGQDAGEALVGVECWVKYDDDEPWQGPIVVDGIDPKAKRRKYDHRSIRHADGDGSFWGSVHARPTYLGRPE